MLAKVLTVAAVLAATAAAPAHACVGCGVKLNGVGLNGFTLNGFTLNGVQFNGAMNVRGHQGVGLNGQVIAIEF